MRYLLILLLGFAVCGDWTYENDALVQTTVTQSDTITVVYTEAELITERLQAIAEKHTAQAIINEQQVIVDNMNSAIAGYDDLLELLESLKPVEPDTTDVED